VLASDIPANLEVGLEPSSYFPMGDVGALATALERVTQMPKDPEARAARREWVARAYDWDKVAAQTMDIYRRLLPG
jgi:glycosyltransferase involved in cell wall biosynthesis